MALVAVHAVVYVPTHAPMITIGIRFGMAVGALEYGVVRGIRVARCTDTVRVAMVHREPCVIEGGAQPARSGVTSGARCWEAGRYVIRVVRALVVRLVTAVTVGRDRGVVVVHMAARACDRGVGSGQRETGVVVIEARRTPRGSAVAYITLLGEA